MSEEQTPFDRWCYTAKDERTGLPLLTTFLYRVSGNDGLRFEEGLDILKAAFEAGQKQGANQ